MLTTGFDGASSTASAPEDRVPRGGQHGRLLGADRDEAVRGQLGPVPDPPLLEVDRRLRACGPVAGSSTTTWVSTRSSVPGSSVTPGRQRWHSAVTTSESG